MVIIQQIIASIRASTAQSKVPIITHIRCLPFIMAFKLLQHFMSKLDHVGALELRIMS